MTCLFWAEECLKTLGSRAEWSEREAARHGAGSDSRARRPRSAATGSARRRQHRDVRRVPRAARGAPRGARAWHGGARAASAVRAWSPCQRRASSRSMLAAVPGVIKSEEGSRRSRCAGGAKAAASARHGSSCSGEATACGRRCGAAAGRRVSRRWWAARSWRIRTSRRRRTTSVPRG